MIGTRINKEQIEMICNLSNQLYNNTEIALKLNLSKTSVATYRKKMNCIQMTSKLAQIIKKGYYIEQVDYTSLQPIKQKAYYRSVEEAARDNYVSKEAIESAFVKSKDGIARIVNYRIAFKRTKHTKETVREMYKKEILENKWMIRL